MSLFVRKIINFLYYSVTQVNTRNTEMNQLLLFVKSRNQFLQIGGWEMVSED